MIRWRRSVGGGDVDYRDTNRVKAIAEALGTIGDARAAGPLKQLLSSDMKGFWASGAHVVRTAAAGALENIEKRSSTS